MKFAQWVTAVAIRVAILLAYGIAFGTFVVVGLCVCSCREPYFPKPLRARVKPRGSCESV
jgi:hypothetical protein